MKNMITSLLLAGVFVAGSAFADATVLCTGTAGTGRATLAVTVNGKNELTAVVRKKGSTFPIGTDEEDYRVTEIKKVAENPKFRIYDILGDEGDQSYYNARLLVPRSGKVSSVRWEYDSSGDEERDPPTKLTLRCK